MDKLFLFLNNLCKSVQQRLNEKYAYADYDFYITPFSDNGSVGYHVRVFFTKDIDNLSCVAYHFNRVEFPCKGEGLNHYNKEFIIDTLHAVEYLTEEHLKNSKANEVKVIEGDWHLKAPIYPY